VVPGLGFYAVLGFVIRVPVRMALKRFEAARRHHHHHENKDNYFFHFSFCFVDTKVAVPAKAEWALSGRSKAV
jgi:hypothetical protein